MNDNERMVYTVEEAGKLLGLSRSTAYQYANSGVIPTVKVGTRLKVPKEALEKMLRETNQVSRSKELEI